MKVQELSEIHFKSLHTSSLQLCNHITLTKKYLPKKSTSQQQRQLGKRNLNLFGFIVYIDTGILLASLLLVLNRFLPTTA